MYSIYLLHFYLHIKEKKKSDFFVVIYIYTKPPIRINIHSLYYIYIILATLEKKRAYKLLLRGALRSVILQTVVFLPLDHLLRLRLHIDVLNLIWLHSTVLRSVYI